MIGPTSLRFLSDLRRRRTARGSCRRRKATFLPESLELRLMLSADLAVSEIGPASVKAGSTATYDVTLSNLGPDPASGVVLTDLLSFSTPNGTFAPSSFSIAPAASDPDSFTAAFAPRRLHGDRQRRDSFRQRGYVCRDGPNPSHSAGRLDGHQPGIRDEHDERSESRQQQ